MNPRSVELSKEEEQMLKHIKKHSASERERDRAHALLLSSKGHSIELLSRIPLESKQLGLLLVHLIGTGIFFGLDGNQNLTF